MDMQFSSTPITGKHVLAAMVAFFGVIIAVNFTMATLAATSWTGLEVKNSYVASQDYNRRLAEIERQRDTGWSSRLDRQGDRLTFTISDADGRPLDVQSVNATFRRPVNESDDFAVEFTKSAPGTFQARQPVQPGLWDLAIELTGPKAQTYRRIFRFQVKG